MTDELKGPDLAKLYRVEVYTDMECSEIKALIPINADGSDRTAPIRFFSSVNAIVNSMPREVRFEIPAANLTEASANFDKAATAAVDGFLEHLKRARTEPKILVPGTMPQTH